MWRAPTILIAIVLALLALGVVMLASTSSVKGGKKDDPRLCAPLGELSAEVVQGRANLGVRA